jgi:hypothetical protein
VTPEEFCHAGAKPLLGRSFSRADNRFDSTPVVLIGEQLWKQQFGADPKILGKRVILNQRSYRVIGIMPATFHFPFKSDPVEVWLPRLQDPDLRQLLTDAVANPSLVASMRDAHSRRGLIAD